MSQGNLLREKHEKTDINVPKLNGGNNANSCVQKKPM